MEEIALPHYLAMPQQLLESPSPMTPQPLVTTTSPVTGTEATPVQLSLAVPAPRPRSHVTLDAASWAHHAQVATRDRAPASPAQQQPPSARQATPPSQPQSSKRAGAPTHLQQVAKHLCTGLGPEQPSSSTGGGDSGEGSSRGTQAQGRTTTDKAGREGQGRGSAGAAVQGRPPLLPSFGSEGVRVDIGPQLAALQQAVHHVTQLVAARFPGPTLHHIILPAHDMNSVPGLATWQQDTPGQAGSSGAPVWAGRHQLPFHFHTLNGASGSHQWRYDALPGSYPTLTRRGDDEDGAESQLGSDSESD